MATPNQNGLTQHIEKIALVVALVVLGVCVLMTMTGGESKVTEVNSASLSQVNDELLRMANAKRVAAEPIRGDEIPDVAPWDERAAAAWGITDRIGPVLAITEMIPVVSPPTRTGDGRNIFSVDQDIATRIPTPEKPHAMVGVGYCDTENSNRTAPAEDKLVVHILSSFHASELNAGWGDLLRGSMKAFTPRFARVEVQVQEMNDEGEWGEPRLVKDAGVPPIRDPRNRTETLSLPDVPDWTGTNDAAIVAALNELPKPVPSQNQTFEERILQPPYWKMLNNQRAFMSWTFLIQRNQDAYLSQMVRDVVTAANMPQTGAKTPAPTYQTNYPAGSVPPNYYPTGPYPTGPYPTGPYPTTPTPTPTTPRPTAGAGGDVVDVPAQLPPFTTQRTAKVMVWSHDENAQYNKEYRYRIRVGLVNPLLMNPRLVNEEDDLSARQAVVFSKWSDWSDRVSVPRQVEMFLVGASRPMNVNMRVFTLNLGQRVAQSFSVSVGDMIGSKITRKVDTVDPQNRKITVEQEVDFSTGLTVISIDWNKRVASSNIPSVQITLMDEQGNLFTRIQQADETSPRLKTLQAEANRVEAISKPPEQPKPPVKPPTPPVRQPTRPGPGAMPPPTPPRLL